MHLLGVVADAELVFLSDCRLVRGVSQRGSSDTTRCDPFAHLRLFQKQRLLRRDVVVSRRRVTLAKVVRGIVHKACLSNLTVLAGNCRVGRYINFILPLALVANLVCLRLQLLPLALPTSNLHSYRVVGLLGDGDLPLTVRLRDRSGGLRVLLRLLRRVACVRRADGRGCLLSAPVSVVRQVVSVRLLDR